MKQLEEKEGHITPYRVDVIPYGVLVTKQILGKINCIGSILWVATHQGNMAQWYYFDNAQNNNKLLECQCGRTLCVYTL